MIILTCNIEVNKHCTYSRLCARARARACVCVSLPAIGRHCTSAAVLIGCHAQRNGPIESNGEI